MFSVVEIRKALLIGYECLYGVHKTDDGIILKCNQFENAKLISEILEADIANKIYCNDGWFDIHKKEPDDHEFVLISHQRFKTPMKAKFHVNEGFEFWHAIGHDFSYLFDGDVKWWTKLPNKPFDNN